MDSLRFLKFFNFCTLLTIFRFFLNNILGFKKCYEFFVLLGGFFWLGFLSEKNSVVDC